jgi:hypothetical protein
MNKKATAVGIVSALFTLSAILMNVQYSNVALAQYPPPPPPGEDGVINEQVNESQFLNQTETAPIGNDNITISP